MKGAFAYTRDPSLLFHPPACGFAPPLNFESVLFDGRQPVRYQKKRLIRPLDNTIMSEGDVVGIVDIDWFKGKVVGYYNAEEALNGIPTFSVENFWIQCAPETEYDYIHETLALLRRGHSLLHPLCTCQHKLSSKRCQTLGISSMYSEYNRRRQEIPCILTGRPREFSAEEVSKELGISDIILFNLQTTPLLPLLNKICSIRMQGMNLFFSCKDYVFNPLNNREDLLRVLSHNPLPISITRDQYPCILNDVRELEAEGLVYAIEGEPLSLFYLHPRWNMPVDQDIQALWHNIKSKDIAQALPRQLCVPIREVKEKSKRRYASKRGSHHGDGHHPLIFHQAIRKK